MKPVPPCVLDFSILFSFQVPLLGVRGEYTYVFEEAEAQ